MHWKIMLYDWTPEMLKFYLNAFQHTLPDPSNLARWSYSEDSSCPLCSNTPCTARHILAGCKVALDQGRYTYRHDKVLAVIREVISLSVARANKGLTVPSKPPIQFVRDGSKGKKHSTTKPFSIIEKASDWILEVDSVSKQYQFPESLGCTALRPDITLYSLSRKMALIVELTVPWESNIPKDHEYKLNKYHDLANAVTRNGFTVHLHAVEVGARGLPAKSLFHLFKDLGLSRKIINSFLEKISKTAISASQILWLRRGSEWVVR